MARAETGGPVTVWLNMSVKGAALAIDPDQYFEQSVRCVEARALFKECGRRGSVMHCYASGIQMENRGQQRVRGKP